MKNYLLLLLCLCVHSASATIAATSVFFNGHLLESKPVDATAIAIIQDRIMAVGQDAQIKRLIGPNTIGLRDL